jgi:HK97 gp10 family phage protein
MDVKTLEVTGLDELQAQLNKLEAYAYKSVLKDACKKAAAVVADEARSLAPEKTGRLKRAIKVRMGRTGNKSSVSALATVGKKWFAGDEFYGAFQEFGWKAGPRKGNKVKGDKDSDKRTQQPGEHFMENAFDSKGQEALDTLLNEIKAGLDRELGGQ